MSTMITGLILFLGIHLLPAVPTVRLAIVDRLGANRYKALFSLASAAGLVLIVVGYAHSEARDRIFAPFPAAIGIAPYAMTVSFILLAAANMRGHLRRILQHPMLIGVLIWSLVHLLANGDRTGTVLFGALFAFAVLDLLSAIGRHAVKVFQPEARFDLIAIGAGIAVALAVMTFHRVLFGKAVAAFGI
jgi:uncharacterized membrane protein